MPHVIPLSCDLTEISMAYKCTAYDASLIWSARNINGT